MKYSRFEELPVWQAAAKLATGTYAFTREQRLPFSFKDQLERAALSVSNNIAEGFERGTTQELLTFLYIARGSAGEVRSILNVLEMLQERKLVKFEISNLKSQISELKDLAESIARQLRGWADSLQNSEIKGQRYLTDSTRRQNQQTKQQAEFLAQVEEIVSQARERDDIHHP